MSQMMQMYQQVGPAQFSAMIGQVAPYFASIAPQFVELRPGYAEVTFPKRREVLNHIGTVHAIALCNAAELAAGTMTDASIPAGHRWIPRGMTVEYLAKADWRRARRGRWPCQMDWQARKATSSCRWSPTSATRRSSAPRSPCTSARPDPPPPPPPLSPRGGPPGGQLYSRSHEQTTETAP